MRKVLLAINNSKLVEKLKRQNNIKIICNNLQYREAILEVLEKNKNIEFILIYENLPGIISIEELLKKIKIINNRINIVFFLEKENDKKKNKLENLQIENIYLNGKVNADKIINLILYNNSDKMKINNKGKAKEKLLNKVFIKINKFRDDIFKTNINLNNQNNKLITLMGKQKDLIINLLINYLLKKDKKILLINFNKKIENKYLNLIKKKYNKKTKKNNNYNNNKIKNIFLKSEMKINNNLIVLKDFQKIIEKNNFKILRYFLKFYIKKYDYILVDMNDSKNNKINQKILKRSDKNLIIVDNNLLGFKEIRRLNQKLQLKEENIKNSLHIIINKYYFNSVSKLIFKIFIKKKLKSKVIFLNKKVENIQIQILKNKKFKVNVFLKYKLKNILNN